jgi:muramidase (phage lysozyme)
MPKLPDIVPDDAQLLLDFIGGYEGPEGFDTIYGNNQDKLPKQLTAMTIGEIVDAQPSWTRRFGSSAAGRYQFMRATLQGICKEVPTLRGDAVFNAGLQNRLGYYLLLRRDYQRFIDGKISTAAFGLNLAKEWASFPVLVACKGAHRVVNIGQSYYAGDGKNKALVAAEHVEDALARVLAKAHAGAGKSTH